MSAINYEGLRHHPEKRGVVLGQNGGFTFKPDQSLTGIPPANSPIIQDVHTVFNLKGFERPRMPFVIGTGDLSKITQDINLNSIPLRFPGTEYRIPNELEPVRSIIETCASFEEKANPHADGYYTYLSLQRSYVAEGGNQGSGGPHSDEIQGRRVQPKQPIIQVYVVTDGEPTEYFPQPFDMTGIDPHIHLMDAVFEPQIDRSKAIRFDAGDIVFFDTYSVSLLKSGPLPPAQYPRG